MEMAEKISESQQKNLTEAGSRLLARCDLKKLIELLFVWDKERNEALDHQNIINEARNFLTNDLVVGCFENEMIVGIIAFSIVKITWKAENIIYEGLTFVHPGYRGKGIMSKLLEQVEEIGKEKECKHIIMGSNFWGSNNPEVAKNVLLKNGYQLHGYLMRKGL